MKAISTGRLLGSAAIAALGAAGFSAAANAQDAPQAGATTSAPEETAAEKARADGDIIVMARRRGEESLQVPVVVTAFSADQISRLGVNSVTDLARLTPQLSAEVNVGPYGGTNKLRGVTSPNSSVSADPAVLVVMDNIPVSTGSVNRLGQFDLGQAEILKGPQALFFGKNSSGGIISLTSAEPTQDFETLLSAEYETLAREWQVNGMISGPLTDSLRGRIAAKGLTQRGYFFNQAPNAKNPIGPNTKEVAVRGTLIFEPSDSLTVKAKATYDRVHDGGTYYGTQRFFCPSGVPAGASASPSITDCKIDKYFARGDLPAGMDVSQNDPLFRPDGAPMSRVRQILTSLDIRYDIAPGISLNSITGYYDLKAAYSDSVVRGPNPVLFAAGSDRKKTFSEELRLSSDNPGSPFTWMVGGFYQDDDLYDFSHALSFAPATGVISTRGRANWEIHSKTYSGFGQASYEFIDGLTLSGGARYTSETKTQTADISPKFLPKIKFRNTSPEVTLTYMPNSHVNIFGSYKQGYKSGTFQMSNVAFAALIANPAVAVVDNSYKEETVKGFEGGFKAALFDRSLRIDTAIYSYLYSDLQLNLYDPIQSLARIYNVTSARVKGVEVQLNYAPRSVPGLRLFGSVAYNDARYKDFQSACFVGQTLAQGCTIRGPGAGANPNFQDLSGKVLPYAPKWAGNVGVSYDTDLGSDLKFGINTMINYQTKSFLGQEETPWGVRPRTTLLDAGARIGAANGGWEVALIGKNLTNKLYAFQGFQENGTGNPATTGTAVGGPSDYTGSFARGREVRIRLTIRPGAL